MKNIYLCADDYGMSIPINKGILQLLELKRLSAVSCASNFSEWKNTARDLKPFTTQINIGLHFNIQKPLFWGLKVNFFKFILY